VARLNREWRRKVTEEEYETYVGLYEESHEIDELGFEGGRDC